MRRGDLYWVNFEPAVGGEIRKRRPAVIVSNDESNRVLNRLQVVPCKSRIGWVYPSEAVISVAGTQAKAMVDQIRTVARERLLDRIGPLSQPELRAVEQAIKRQLGLV